MSQTPTTSVSKPDVLQGPEPTRATNAAAQAPVLITEQEVLFSTAVALSRPPTVSRRVLDAIRAVGAALQPGPARRRYPSRRSYLEQSCMSREMDRL